MPETMSFVKSVFGDSDVKWSLPSLKAQPRPGSSLSLSFMASATLPTSSPISWTSFPFSGVKTGLQIGQAHSRQGPQKVQAGPAATRHASHGPRSFQGRPGGGEGSALLYGHAPPLSRCSAPCRSASVVLQNDSIRGRQVLSSSFQVGGFLLFVRTCFFLWLGYHLVNEKYSLLPCND